jgi:predicted RNA-binding protein Jag
MIDFVRLQTMMKERLEADRSISSVEATGATLDEAVSAAASLLAVSIKRIEYEVIDRGSTGFLGTGRKDWIIRAYERAELKTVDAVPEMADETFSVSAPVIEDKDGSAFVYLSQEDAFLKVTPPIGRGRRATERQAMDALAARSVRDINAALSRNGESRIRKVTALPIQPESSNVRKVLQAKAG